MKQHKHGFVLGKFMPLHKGHVHLLRVAESLSDKLSVLVCSLPNDPIPGELRYKWVKNMFPNARVFHLSTWIPQTPEEDSQFWHIWRETITRMIPTPIDLVFASESYGWRLAKELSAEHVPVDRERSMMPISGTEVRKNPIKQWDYIPEPVRQYYTKRVAIVGPESVGKSTLVKNLAAHFNTIGVEEYARQLFDALVEEGKRKPGEFRYEDLSLVARGQAALEESLANDANKILISDTDVLTTLTWSEYLYGKSEKWLQESARHKRYDLTLLLHPEGTEYVQDGQRIMNKYTKRLDFTERLERNLKKVGREYVVLTGTHKERFDEAVKMINKILNRKKF